MHPAVIQKIKSDVAALKADYPELEHDLDFLADVVEGETDVPAIVEALIIERRERLAHAKAMSDLAKDYMMISNRHEGTADAIKRTIGAVMDAATVRKVSTPAGTVSLSPGRMSLKLMDGFEPPQGYARVRVEPDKAAIKEALENGETMPGAALVRGPDVVTIR